MSVITGQKEGQGTPPPEGSGNQPPSDWRAGLPEELRGDKSLESIKGKDWAEAGPVLVKNYIHAQSLVGADKIIIPGKDATKEQVAEYRKKLGVPEKPEDYAHKLPEGLTEDKIDKKLLDTWKQRLHAQGLSKTQAEAVIADYLTDNVGTIKANETAAAKQQEKWELELKTKFGGDYDKQVNFARHALDKLGNPELTALLDSSGLGSNPAVVEFFAKAGKAISDDSARGNGGSQFSGKPTSAAGAQSALEAFNRDVAKQEALWKPEHPQHAHVVAERNELFQMAFPSKKT